ncbi:hypothetical protein Isop_0178 [Isosphaera pallida ATCC 43644]|uniref:SGNH hydrolase-type esterase domain-containing protein n=1 Tax=Isosphaera pallida (strain ATCC 43644 / DSM 9630 / IS1B) TaxID=575540 RepID=E8R680_ISOPI|nr:hypothetical protein [Isosphaera pallida]ADV60775.1 hypothetical protein Isop_0178 [Isosphaera pallida ATCC 43644]
MRPLTLVDRLSVAAALGLALLAVLPTEQWTSASLVLRFKGAVRNDGPNQIDLEQRERGYYEKVLEVHRGLDRIDGGWGDPIGTESENQPQPFRHGGLVQDVADVRDYVLKPNLDTRYWDGVRWSTNARGMRDREYAIPKPPGVTRYALVGDSIGCGWGVDQSESFEAITEAQLDREARAFGRGGFELLNHSVPGHAPGQRWADFLANDGWRDELDGVIVQATPAEVGWDERRLRVLLARGPGFGFDAPMYAETLAQAGARPGDRVDGYRRRLEPWRWAILEGVYRHIAQECRARGVRSWYILVPRVGKTTTPSQRRELLSLAARCGFDEVHDLTGVIPESDPARYALSPRDYHPNALGHRLLAEALIARLRPAATSAGTASAFRWGFSNRRAELHQ